MSLKSDILRRDVISWALYDFANTIYSMNILSLYFAGWVVIDMGYRDIYYSTAYSISMLACALVMPALGHLSDRNQSPIMNDPTPRGGGQIPTLKGGPPVGGGQIPKPKGGPPAPRGGAHVEWFRLMRQPRLTFLFIFTLGAVGSIIAFSLLAPLADYVLVIRSWSFIGQQPLVIPGIVVIMVLFAFSNFFYEGGIVFYNALIDVVSTKDNVGKVSGFGVAMGYFGSIVGMVLVLPFVTGELFGIDIPIIEGGGKAAAFLPTAVFYALFSIPIFLFVRPRESAAALEDVVLPVNEAELSADTPGAGVGGKPGLKEAYRDVWQTVKSTRKYPGLLRFLVADYFFEDAIATTIIFMAVFTERVLGMDAGDRTIFFIISTAFAMVGAYILGHLADRLSPKRVLFAIVAGWIIVLTLFAVNNYRTVFWILGPIIGILLGGVWSVSRPLLIQLTPPEKLGEFFGLFSLSGRAAAVCGPLVWGATVYLIGGDQVIGRFLIDLFDLGEAAAAKLPYRFAVLSLAAMMGLGLFIFRKVPERKRTP